MKIGQAVHYMDPAGRVHPALLCRILPPEEFVNPTSGALGLQERIDLVYIDENGMITRKSGILEYIPCLEEKSDRFSEGP